MAGWRRAYWLTVACFIKPPSLRSLRWALLGILKSMRPRLADVARMAGVDVSTASRVLRGEESQRIRPETRQ
ncbi:LacI family DNA-binding transcriptional regulator, partial [Acinetobacter baumannii]